jgi:hypothetical protein
VKINAKTPGLYTRAIPTEMDLTYKRRFTDTKIPEAYEALILDALKGDHSNFVRDDELDVAWKVRLHCPILPITHFLSRSSRRSCTGSRAAMGLHRDLSRTRMALGGQRSLTTLLASMGTSERALNSKSVVSVPGSSLTGGLR